jgi:ABC-2 type transport system permease protein
MADVAVGISIAAVAFFTFACIAMIAWIFRAGYKIRT